MYYVGKQYWTPGLDMNCKPVTTTVRLLKIQEADEHGFDCVTWSEDCMVLGRLEDLIEITGQMTNLDAAIVHHNWARMAYNADKREVTSLYDQEFDGYDDNWYRMYRNLNT